MNMRTTATFVVAVSALLTFALPVASDETDDQSCASLISSKAHTQALNTALTQHTNKYCAEATETREETCKVKQRYVFGCFAAITYIKEAKESFHPGVVMTNEVTEGATYNPVARKWTADKRIAFKTLLNGEFYTFNYSENYLLSKIDLALDNAPKRLVGLKESLEAKVPNFCSVYMETC
jgi:hypothetical protein